MMETFDGREAWWGFVTGPREIVSDTLGSLSQGRSVSLVTKGNLPWRDEFWRRVTAGLALRPGTIGMTFKDMNSDDMRPEDEPVDSLLRKFALEDDMLGYRVGMDPHRYLIERHVLTGMVVHVHGLDSRRLRQWTEFCAKWPKGSRETGMFLLEMEEAVGNMDVGNLERVSYAERVSGYSRQLFCGLCLEHGISSKLSEEHRRYLASAATYLCGEDIEMSERLAIRLSRPPFDPMTAYTEIVKTEPSEEAMRRLWEAQIETIFSVVQRRHMAIVDRLRPQIQEALARYTIVKNKERIYNPDDTDPGTLVYLFTARNPEDERLLFVPDEGLRDEIRLLADCRNALAHRRCCTEEQVRQLLD